MWKYIDWYIFFLITCTKPKNYADRMQLKAKYTHKKWKKNKHKNHHEAFQQCSIIALINFFNWIWFNLGYRIGTFLCYLNNETCYLIDDCMSLKLTESFVFCYRLSIVLISLELCIEENGEHWWNFV